MHALILHSVDGHAGVHWQQWLHNELTELGVKVSMPNLPNPHQPDRRAWLQSIQEIVNQIGANEQTIIIAHSLGVASALDYIESITKPILGLISVSGFAQNYGSPLNESFMKEKNIDLDKVKQNCENFRIIYGDNDPYVPQETLIDLAIKLDQKPIVVKDGGHLNSETGYTAFPQLLDIFKEIAQFN